MDLSLVNYWLVLELLGVGFGVVQVLLSRNNNVLLYPFGIASVLISCFLFFEAGLYAESLLNVYYLAMSIYGWWLWGNKNNKVGLKVAYWSDTERWGSIVIVLGGTGLLSYLLHRYTNSDVSMLDAIVSAFAWAGMWLLSRRKIENWIFLNISNAIAVPLLIYKEMYMYAAFTVFLFLVAVSGYFKWKRIILNEK